MVTPGPDRPPDEVRRQYVAALLRNLPAGGEHVVASLDAVLLLTRAWCPSCVAVSLTVDPGGEPVTVTVTLNPGHRHSPSLTVRLPRADPDRTASAPAVLVLFATDTLALAHLAGDLRTLLDIDPDQVTLAAAAPVPPPTSAGLAMARQLSDRATVDRALGALLAQGWLPHDGRAELQRRAHDAGGSLVQAAAAILTGLPGLSAG